MTDRESRRQRGRAQHWWRRTTQAARGRSEWRAASALPLRPPLSASARSSATAALCSQQSRTRCSSPMWCYTQSGKGMWPPRSVQTQSALSWLQNTLTDVCQCQISTVQSDEAYITMASSTVWLQNKFLINTACLSPCKNCKWKTC